MFGYGVAQTLVQVLQQCGDDLTRENVMKQAANLKISASTSAAGHQDQHQRRPTSHRSSQLQMMRFKGEKWELFGDMISAELSN